MKVWRICLGCMRFGDAEHGLHKWVLNEENSRPIIQKALEMGINFFDTANVYSNGTSEEFLGRALKDFAKRDEVIIATKVQGKMPEGPNGSGLSHKAILSEIDNGLLRANIAQDTSRRAAKCALKCLFDADCPAPPGSFYLRWDAVWCSPHAEEVS